MWSIFLISFAIISEVRLVKELELAFEAGCFSSEVFRLGGDFLQLLERPFDVRHVLAHLRRRLVHKMAQARERRR